MKKLGKVLSVLLIVFALLVALTTNVKAAEQVDLSGYSEVGGEEDIPTIPSAVEEDKKKDTEATTPSTTTETTGTKTETKTEEVKENVATKDIAQAGSIVTTVSVSAGIVLVVALGIGYKKLKRYSF